MAPTTPAMTAQEALAILRAGEKTVYAVGHPYLPDRMRSAIAVLETALSDAERRATEAENKLHNRLHDADEATAELYAPWVERALAAESRLSAVEARCGRMMDALKISGKHQAYLDGFDAAVATAESLEIVNTWWGPEATLNDAQDEGRKALILAMQHQRSILAYPGGKSDQGEKEKA